MERILSSDVAICVAIGDFFLFIIFKFLFILNNFSPSMVFLKFKIMTWVLLCYFWLMQYFLNIAILLLYIIKVYVKFLKIYH